MIFNSAKLKVTPAEVKEELLKLHKDVNKGKAETDPTYVTMSDLKILVALDDWASIAA